MLVRGGVLAQFLNAVDGKAEQKRVLRLRDYCLLLQQCLDEIIEAGRFIHAELAPSVRAGRVVYQSPTLYCGWVADKKVGRTLRETNQLLARYSFRRSVPVILKLTEEGPPTVSTEAVPRLKSEQEETRAVEMLLSLAEWGALGQLLHCPACKRWFMARRTDQVFCSTECGKRQHYARRDPKEWNAYMRKHRRRERIRKLLAKLQYKLPSARLLEKKQIKFEIGRLNVEYKSLLGRKKEIHATK
jgi:hypothetical protein